MTSYEPPAEHYRLFAKQQQLLEARASFLRAEEELIQSLNPHREAISRALWKFCHSYFLPQGNARLPLHPGDLAWMNKLGDLRTLGYGEDRRKVALEVRPWGVYLAYSAPGRRADTMLIPAVYLQADQGKAVQAAKAAWRKWYREELARQLKQLEEAAPQEKEEAP